jgi:hypothetical protein
MLQQRLLQVHSVNFAGAILPPHARDTNSLAVL